MSRVVKYQEFKGMPGEEIPQEQTIEEKLLEALLVANAGLVDVLSQYDDMEKVAMEHKAEDLSRKAAKRDPWVSFLSLKHYRHVIESITSFNKSIN